MLGTLLVACLLSHAAAAGLLLRLRPPSMEGQQQQRGRANSSTEQHLPRVHFAYTTGCNDYQLTHSVVLDHSWVASGNTGRLTRIVANCHDPHNRALMEQSPLRDDKRFTVFFVDGSLDQTSTGKTYPARSRPHALSRWMESQPPTEPVVALSDPDFVFLRSVSQYPGLANVSESRMVSPASWWGPGPREYQTGPLWLMSSQALKKILPLWQEYTDKAAKKSDDLMREQFAFQKAAEKLRIPSDFDSKLSTASPQSVDELYTLHYYSSYNYKQWQFHKALATSGWYADHFKNTVPPPVQCGAPLLQEPPALEEGGPMQMVMLSALIPKMNQAFRAFREVYCDKDRNAFAQKGLKAFGLMRTNHPINCKGHAGTTTRYLVEENDSPITWDTSQPLGGAQCSSAAQMW